MGTQQLDPETRIVIIGAGVVGAALADDLVRVHGMRSVTVVEQGPLYECGGASSHAPGFAFQTTGSHVMSELAKRTLDKLDGAELDGKWVMKRVGGLELARTPERLEYLHRRHNYAESWGVPAEIVSPERCAELFPGLTEEGLLGGLYTPTDGVVKSARAVEFQARRAIEHGAVFYGLTQVSDIRVEGGSVTGVEVRSVPSVPGNENRGESLPEGIEFLPAEIVVVCAGMWGPRFGERFGLELPMVPMEHCENWTTDLPGDLGVDGETEIESPLIRDQQTGLYLRQYGGGYIWGTYEHRVIPVTQTEIADPEAFAATGVHPAIHPLTPADLDEMLATVNELFPASRETSRIDGMNGIFTFTPDGNPMLGEVPGVAGLWFGLSVWLTQSAGVAGMLSDWIVTGDPGIDTTSLDFKRFDQAHLTRTASIAWASESRAESYRIAHPRKHSAEMRELSTSPFYARQQALGAVFGQVEGWERPLWFGDSDVCVTGMVTGGWDAFGSSPNVMKEARAAITGAGVVDRTEVRVLEVEVADEVLCEVFGWTKPAPVDASRGALLRDAEGRIAAAYTVVRTRENAYLVLGSEAAAEFLLRRAFGERAVVRDCSAGYTALSVVGPSAAAVLAAQGVGVGDRGLEGIQDFQGAPVRVLADPLISDQDVLLLCAPQHGLFVWDGLFAVQGVNAPVAIGTEALRVLSVSAGIPAFRVDYGSRDSISDAGLVAGVVGDGSSVLARLRLCEPGPALVHGEPVRYQSQVVGSVTSAASDPTDGHVRAFVRLPQELAVSGMELSVAYLGRVLRAKVDQFPVKISSGGVFGN